MKKLFAVSLALALVCGCAGRGSEHGRIFEYSEEIQFCYELDTQLGIFGPYHVMNDRMLSLMAKEIKEWQGAHPQLELFDREAGEEGGIYVIKFKIRSKGTASNE